MPPTPAPAPAPLPDVERLAAMPDGAVRALGERLRLAGPLAPLLAKLTRAGERLDDALRAPMRAWNARRMTEPGAIALRALVLGDPVEADRARAVLGDLGPMVEAGLLVERDGGVVSPFRMALLGALACFGDEPGSGGVVAVGGVTGQLAQAAMPLAPVEAALDVGCGAGPLALLLARAGAARRVVATDVDPRALALARFNARLAGGARAGGAGERLAFEVGGGAAAAAVELRQGDLFEPVRGERFDLVVSQPPFMASHPGAAPSTFAHGGARGDELPLRLLRGVAPHLTPRGRAVVAADWPLLEAEALDARVRDALASGGEPTGAVVLASPSKNLDEYCTLYAAAEHATLDAAFARAAMAQRDHLEALGVRGIAFALVVAEPAGHGGAWATLVPVRHPTDAPMLAHDVERILAAKRLARAPREDLWRAALRVPEGVHAAEQPAIADVPSSVVFQLARGRPEPPAVVDAETARVVGRIHAARDVGAAAEALAREGVTADRVESAARAALGKGVLEVARG